MNELDALVGDPQEIIAACIWHDWKAPRPVLAKALAREAVRSFIVKGYILLNQDSLARIRSAAGLVGWAPVYRGSYTSVITAWKPKRRKRS
jgi:hypothetical protein